VLTLYTAALNVFLTGSSAHSVCFQLKPRRDTTFNPDMRRQLGGRTCLEATCGDVLQKIHSLRWWNPIMANRLGCMD
jgi:hypothetical protein